MAGLYLIAALVVAIRAGLYVGSSDYGIAAFGSLFTIILLAMYIKEDA